MAEESTLSRIRSRNRGRAGIARALLLNGLLVAIPLAIYYVAVVKRQESFQSERSFRALGELTKQVDLRLQAVVGLLRSAPRSFSAEERRIYLQSVDIPGLSFVEVPAQTPADDDSSKSAGKAKDRDKPASVENTSGGAVQFVDDQARQRCEPPRYVPQLLLRSEAGKWRLEIDCGNGSDSAKADSAAKSGGFALTFPASALTVRSARAEEFDQVLLTTRRGEVLAAFPTVAPGGTSTASRSMDAAAGDIVPEQMAKILQRVATAEIGAPPKSAPALPGTATPVPAGAAAAASAAASLRASSAAVAIDGPAFTTVELRNALYRAYVLPYRPPYAAGSPCIQGEGCRTPSGKQVERFCDPAAVCRLAEAFYLVGLKRQRVADTAGHSLGTTSVTVLVAVVLVLALSWPMLRLRFVEPFDSVSWFSVRVLVLSVVCLVTVLTALSLSLLLRQRLLQAGGHEAVAVAQDVRAKFDASVDQHLALMLKVQQNGMPIALEQTDCTKQSCGSGQARPPECSSERLPLAYWHPDDQEPLQGSDAIPPGAVALFRVSGQQQSLAAKDPASCEQATLPSCAGGDKTACVQPVGSLQPVIADSGYRMLALGGRRLGPRRDLRLDDREYFQRLQRGEGYYGKLRQDDGAEASLAFVLMRLQNLGDGSRIAQYALRSPGDAFQGIVALDAQMPVFTRPILPLNFQYAIVDSDSGIVQFHSDDGRSLIEDFRVETGYDPRVRAALDRHIADSFSAVYRGRPTRLAMQPSERLPWTVVVLFEEDPLAAVALAVYLNLLAAVLPLLIAGLCLASLLVWLCGGNQLWLWPQWRLRNAYLPATLLFIALGLINWGALKLAANQTPWLIFLAPSLFATLGMALLGLPLSFARSWWPVILCWLLHGGLLLLTTVLAASAAGGRGMVAASLVYLAALALCINKQIQTLSPGSHSRARLRWADSPLSLRPRLDVQTLWAMHWHYAAMLCAALVFVGAGPVDALYRAAAEQHLHVGLLNVAHSTLQQARHRLASSWRDFQWLAQETPVPKGTRIQIPPRQPAGAAATVATAGSARPSEPRERQQLLALRPAALAAFGLETVHTSAEHHCKAALWFVLPRPASAAAARPVSLHGARCGTVASGSLSWTDQVWNSLVRTRTSELAWAMTRDAANDHSWERVSLSLDGGDRYTALCAGMEALTGTATTHAAPAPQRYCVAYPQPDESLLSQQAQDLAQAGSALPALRRQPWLRLAEPAGALLLVLLALALVRYCSRFLHGTPASAPGQFGPQPPQSGEAAKAKPPLETAACPAPAEAAQGSQPLLVTTGAAAAAHDAVLLVRPEAGALGDLSACAQLDLASADQACLDRFRTGPGQIALLRRLDVAMTDAAQRKLLLPWLEKLLLRARCRAVFTVEVPPLYRYCRPGAYSDFAAEAEAGAERFRWIELFARLRKAYRKLDNPLPDDQARRGSAGAPAVSELIELETRVLWPRLAAVREALKQLDSETLNERDVIDFVSMHGEVHFRLAWEHCTLQERLALYQLARGRVVNPENARVIEHLVRRGLVAFEPHPCLKSYAFADFVRHAELPGTVEAWEREASEGVWQSLRAPLLIVLLLLVAWLAYSSGDMMQAVVALVGSSIASLSTLMRAFSFAKGAAGPGDKLPT